VGDHRNWRELVGDHRNWRELVGTHWNWGNWEDAGHLQERERIVAIFKTSIVLINSQKFPEVPSVPTSS
jgi:hypothetical protein